MAPLPPSRLDELRKRYEENPRRFFAPLANEYRKVGDVDQAVALCEMHLSDQPGNMNGHIVYGQALFAAGRHEEATATFSTALTLDPENLIALRHLGDISRLTDDRAHAIEWYSRVLEADPRNEEILGFLTELQGGRPARIAPEAQPAPPEAELSTSVTASPAAAETAPAVLEKAPATLEMAPVVMEAPPAVEAPAAMETEPPRRQSFPLMDIEIDLPQGETEPPMAAAPEPSLPPEPSRPLVPIDEFGFADLGAPTAAPSDSDEFAVPDAAAGSDAATWDSDDVPPNRGDIVSDMGLSWNTPLDTRAITPPTPAASVPDAAVGTPEIFVTETMAELYLQQGFRDAALDVYRKLADQNPADEALRERIRGIEASGAPNVAPNVEPNVEPNIAPNAAPSSRAEPDVSAVELAAAPEVPEVPEVPEAAEAAEAAQAAQAAQYVASMPTPAAIPSVLAPAFRTARSYFAALAQRRAVRADGSPPAGIGVVRAEPPRTARSTGSVDVLFGGLDPEPEDEAQGLALASLVGSGDAISGRPTEPAGSELSLDSVFRGETPRRTSGPVVTQRSEPLKFDQFFAPHEPAAEPPTDGARTGEQPSDDAQFQSWLKGLKEK